MKEDIKTIADCIKFLEQDEDASLEEVNIKYKVWFKNDEEPFNFSSDEELIDWCNTQNDTYFKESIDNVCKYCKLQCSGEYCSPNCCSLDEKEYNKK